MPFHEGSDPPGLTPFSTWQSGGPAAIPLEGRYLGWQQSLIQLAHVVEPDIPPQGWIAAARKQRVDMRLPFPVLGMAIAAGWAIIQAQRASARQSDT